MGIFYIVKLSFVLWELSYKSKQKNRYPTSKKASLHGEMRTSITLETHRDSVIKSRETVESYDNPTYFVNELGDLSKTFLILIRGAYLRNSTMIIIVTNMNTDVIRLVIKVNSALFIFL